VTDVGVLLSQAHRGVFGELTRAAEEHGYESVWLGEHLVIPADPKGELASPGEDHSAISPQLPILDLCGVLCWLAAQTSRIRLGTCVYLLGLRHPFVSARALATVDILSGGRAEVGCGVGWIRGEWEAVGANFRSRARCLEESIEVCRRLWAEPVIEHHGDFFSFPPVAFEPKPAQARLPISIGGESEHALRRAARIADGWIGMRHTPQTAAAKVATLRRLERELGRTGPPVRVSVVGELTADQSLSVWAGAGVDRLLVHPWQRTPGAVDGIIRLAGEHFR
jgi:probable F420-dependent oxidoreductase